MERPATTPMVAPAKYRPSQDPTWDPFFSCRTGRQPPLCGDFLCADKALWDVEPCRVSYLPLHGNIETTSEGLSRPARLYGGIALKIHHRYPFAVRRITVKHSSTLCDKPWRREGYFLSESCVHTAFFKSYTQLMDSLTWLFFRKTRQPRSKKNEPNCIGAPAPTKTDSDSD